MTAKNTAATGILVATGLVGGPSTSDSRFIKITASTG